MAAGGGDGDVYFWFFIIHLNTFEYINQPQIFNYLISHRLIDVSPIGLHSLRKNGREIEEENEGSEQGGRGIDLEMM